MIRFGNVKYNPTATTTATAACQRGSSTSGFSLIANPFEKLPAIASFERGVRL
jgi:hypothetical protein